MAVVPATIEQLARDAVRIPDPETALRALGALRRELDETESELVIRALQTGASWAHIARALGVSKQAAHRKHRHLAEQLHLTAPEGGSKILVSVEARRAIQFAREETKRLGQPAIGTEHILLGILRCQQSPAVKALNALGVTHQAAKACIQPTMASLPTAAGATETSAGAEQNVTAHARRILDGSLREAVKRHDGAIGVEHLLLALLADSRNGAVQTLEALKTTPSKVRRQLELDWQTLSESTHSQVSAA